MEIERYYKEFVEIEKKLRDKLKKTHQVNIKTGLKDDKTLTIFKLLKDHWSTSPPDELGNNGVFFCMWVDSKNLKKMKILYGVHQLKLKEVLGPKAKPGQFVDNFRSEARKKLIGQPNVEIDIGPVYLYRGSFIASPEDIEETSKIVIKGFLEINELIDKHLMNGVNA